MRRKIRKKNCKVQNQQSFGPSRRIEGSRRTVDFPGCQPNGRPRLHRGSREEPTNTGKYILHITEHAREKEESVEEQRIIPISADF